MSNVFINLIIEKKISNLKGLKKIYHGALKKTHPDTAGSDKFVDKFIQYKKDYEEALRYLEKQNADLEINDKIESNNYRRLFFIELKIFDELELSGTNTAFFFKKWKEGSYDLFLKALEEYGQIKNEKPRNIISNLRKPSLYNILKPVFFNLCHYHVAGSDIYLKQLNRNLDYIFQKLEEKKYFSVKNFLSLLIQDLKNGPAVFCLKNQTL